MQLQESRLCYSRQEDAILPSNASEDGDKNGLDLRLYLEWRSSMIGWHMNIAQTCHFDLSTVEVATYLVDQYVRRRPEIATQARDFQMLSMACLYLSAKTQEDHCLTPQQLEKLSAGRFVADEIVSMELDILMTLKWQINPPTASSYVRLLLLENETLNIYSRRRLQQLVDSHIEVALVSNRLIGVDAYRLAVAALRMALCCSTDGTSGACRYLKNLDPDTQVVEDLQAIIIEALCVSPESHPVLWEAYQSVLVEASTDDEGDEDEDDDDKTASSKDSHDSDLTPTKSTTTIQICNPSSPRTTVSAPSSKPSSEQKQLLLSTMKAVTTC